MLANVPRSLLLILLITVLVVSALAILFSIFLIIRAIVKAKKTGVFTIPKYIFISVACVLIAIIAFVCNMGWIRVIMLFMAIPFIHTLIFFFINVFAASQIEKSRLLKIFFILSCITYLCGYVFLPDGGDVGPMYVFFGLLHNDITIGICFTLAGLGFSGNVIFLVLQLVEAIRSKKKLNYKERNQK